MMAAQNPNNLIDVEISSIDLLRQLDLLQRMDESMNAELIGAVRKGGAVVRRIEAGKVRKFTGATSRSISSTTKVRGIGAVRAQIGPRSREAKDTFVILENGRPAKKKAPWVWDLEEWALAKGLIAQITAGKNATKNAYNAALFVISRSIGRKGTQGAPIRTPTIQETQGMVLEFISKAVDRIVEKLVLK